MSLKTFETFRFLFDGDLNGCDSMSCELEFWISLGEEEENWLADLLGNPMADTEVDDISAVWSRRLSCE